MYILQWMIDSGLIKSEILKESKELSISLFSVTDKSSYKVQEFLDHIKSLDPYFMHKEINFIN